MKIWKDEANMKLIAITIAEILVRKPIITNIANNVSALIEAQVKISGNGRPIFLTKK